jgi:hypothetical protein
MEPSLMSAPVISALAAKADPVMARTAARHATTIAGDTCTLILLRTFSSFGTQKGT